MSIERVELLYPEETGWRINSAKKIGNDVYLLDTGKGILIKYNIKSKKQEHMNLVVDCNVYSKYFVKKMIQEIKGDKNND